jgi:Tol biopolymer transport system component/DNA-binding winged helix-turn-helix (wHTH) protein
MDLLVYLAEHSGTVCSRRELLDHVWGDVVVGEEVLSQAVSKLRRALGDDSRSPRFIETIARRGYRLVVNPCPHTPAQETDPPAVPVANEATPSRARRRLVTAAPVVLLLLVLMSVKGSPLRIGKETVVPASRVTPLTSLPGVERHPRFSPDERRVAYVAWPESGNADIYVVGLDGESPMRVTVDTRDDVHPAWSPDGERLAYVREPGADGCIVVVPVMGGVPRVLVPARGARGRIDWSSDGGRIVCSEGTPRRIVAYDIDSGARHEVAPGLHDGDDIDPVYSPDGKRIAFARLRASGLIDLFVVRPDDGPRCIAAGFSTVSGFDWSHDGHSIVLSGTSDGNHAVWRIDVHSGTSRWLPVASEHVVDLSISRYSGRMVCSNYRDDTDIKRIRFFGTRSVVDTVVRSSYRDRSPGISPEGDRIAFVSDRCGAEEVWVAGADGSRPYRVTSFGGWSVCAPWWSPDASRILVSAAPDGVMQLFVVELESRECRALTSTASNAFARGWSRDGQCVYFSAHPDADAQCFKLDLRAPELGGIPVSGGFPAEPVYAVARDGEGAVLTMRHAGITTAIPLVRVDDAACNLVSSSADGRVVVYTARGDRRGDILLIDVSTR